MAVGPSSAVAPEVLSVLVVDDNASLLRFLVSAFSANGCTVTPAATAEQALERLTQREFDLVVSDIKMPGLSGLDVLRAVKGKQPGTPVVLITGNPSVNSAVFGLRHGAYDYLPKPFSIREIQELLARIRTDRQRWDGQVPLPAGLTEELSRRQSGVAIMSRIGDLALKGLETSAFMDEVLALIGQSITSDASLVLRRDEQGAFSSSQRGSAALLAHLSTGLHRSFEGLLGGGHETVALAVAGEPLEVIAAPIPGVGQSAGLVCLARRSSTGGFLPDERDLLLGFAQTTAVAMQRLILRENVERNLVDTITAFVNAIESKDRYLKGHSARVALYAGEIAQHLAMPPEMVEVVRRGAMLHDLGKLSIMDTILRKPERLTDEEFTIIKSHPVVGAKILEPLRFLARETCAVRHHHERWDGTGYPDGLRGEDIPIVARVVTVADVFDAITSDRPYRTALSPADAREEILQGRGTHFDPAVAEAFLRIPLDRLEEINRHYDSLSTEGGPGAPALAQAK
jgi:putative nucleotidyltransferase with HDIG domain